MMYRNQKRTWLISMGLLSFSACISIPPESVELSTLVGELVQSAKLSHFNLVNLHFDFRRKEIESFAFNGYKGAFLDNVRKLLKEQDSSFEELSLAQYDRSMDRVRKKNNEWIEIVEQDRRKVLQALEEHYSVLLGSNAELTALLKSGADLSETRSSLLARWGPKFGITAEKIKEVEDRIADSVSKVREALDEAMKKLGGQ